MSDKDMDGLSDKLTSLRTHVVNFDELFTLLQESPTIPSFLIPETVGQSMTLNGREDALQCIMEGFAHQYAETSIPRNREDHPIYVVASAPGMGKTRLLTEIPQALKDAYTDLHPYVYIVSYNNGQPPTKYDFALPIACLVLRLFYFNYPRIYRKFQSFSFFAQAVFDNWEETTIAKLNLEFFHSKTRRPVICAIDEFNYLIEPNNLLKPIFQAVSGACLAGAQHKPFFAVFAGTTLQPLSGLFRLSSHPYKAVPMPLFTHDHIHAIASNQTWLKDWETKKAFCRCLYAFGQIPRILENYLLICKKKGVTTEDLPMKSIVYSIHAEATKRYGCRDPHLEVKLIFAVFLRLTVTRDTEVIPGTTYGDLENRGQAILVQCRGSETQDCLVEIPYIILRTYLDDPSQLAQHGMPQRLLQMLRKLFNLDDGEGLLESLSFKGFETFSALFEACRSHLLFLHHTYTLLQEPPRISLNRLFEGGKFAKNIDTETRILLAPLTVLRDKNRFSGGTCAATNHVVLPGDGSVVDSYSVRMRLDEEDEPQPLICAGQMKAYQSEILTKPLIMAEVKKAAEAFEENPYVLCIISPRESPFCSEIPDNCIMLCGENLVTHYHVFAEHLRLSIDGAKVNINSASDVDLQVSLYRVGPARSKDIQDKAKVRAFTDWKDLTSRVKGIPKTNEDRIRYI